MKMAAIIMGEYFYLNRTRVIVHKLEPLFYFELPWEKQVFYIGVIADKFNNAIITLIKNFKGFNKAFLRRRMLISISGFLARKGFKLKGGK